MKVYAVRCVSGIDHPEILWEAGDWVGRHSGNPTDDLEDAEFIADKEAAILRQLSLERMGCIFEIHVFDLILDDIIRSVPKND